MSIHTYMPYTTYARRISDLPTGQGAVFASRALLVTIYGRPAVGSFFTFCFCCNKKVHVV